MERRKFKRIKSNMDINFKLKKDPENDKLEKGQTCNISQSGVLVKYNKPLNVNSIVNVEFHNPDNDDFFESDAKIVRVEVNTDDDYEIGLEFLKITDIDSRKLTNFINFQDTYDIEEETGKNYYFIEIELPEETSINKI